MNALLQMMVNPKMADITGRYRKGFDRAQAKQLRDIALQERQEDRMFAAQDRDWISKERDRKESLWETEDAITAATAKRRDEYSNVMAGSDDQAILGAANKAAAFGDKDAQKQLNALYQERSAKKIQSSIFALNGIYSAKTVEDKKVLAVEAVKNLSEDSPIKQAVMQRVSNPNITAAELDKGALDVVTLAKEAGMFGKGGAQNYSQSKEYLDKKMGQTDQELAFKYAKLKAEGNEPTGPNTDQAAYMRDFEIIQRNPGTPEAKAAEERMKEALAYKREQAPETTAKAEGKAGVEAKYASQIAKAKKSGEMLAKIQHNAAELASRGETTPAAKKTAAKAQIEGVLAKMAGNYDILKEKNAIVDVDNTVAQNTWAALRSSGGGQFLENMMGTSVQSTRNSIKSAQPLLINFMRQASEMGARGMDSTQELEFYLQAASDPSRDIQSNMAALIILSDAYGNGEIGDILRHRVDSKLYRSMKAEGNKVKRKDKSAGKVDYNYIQQQYGGGQQTPVPDSGAPIAPASNATVSDIPTPAAQGATPAPAAQPIKFLGFE